ncbi:MAG: hypothetical protein ACRDUV_10530 [Pseudonocardiaceae bacterium]
MSVMRRRHTAAPPEPPQDRLLVPVLAPTGGVGRSVLSYLLAARLAEQARTLVVDAAPGLASPWDRWLTRPGTGPCIRSSGESLSAQRLYASAGQVAAGTGGTFSVLTTPHEHEGNALAVPALVRLVETFAPRVALVDTGTPLLRALSADSSVRMAEPLGWLRVASSTPLLCASASAKGVVDVLNTVNTLQERGMSTGRLTVAVVGIASTVLPRRVQAGLTLLEPQVGAIVRLPHEPRLHGTGAPSLAKATPRLRAALDQLLAALVRQPLNPRNPSPMHTATPTPIAGGAHALADRH